MWKHLNKLVVFTVSVWPLLVASALWAAEEGPGAHGEHAGVGSQLLGLVFFSVNFVLFVLLLRRYALPVVRDALRRRRETIVQALNEAKRAQEEAEQMRREYEEKLAGLAAEQERIRAQAVEAAQREKERILEDARRLAERVHTEAHLIAQREVEGARRVLRDEVAKQAVRVATDLLRSHLAPADQGRFVQDLIREVNNARNDGR